MWQRHATDVVSLVFGTIFAGVTAVWLLNVTDVIDLEEAWLGGPVILIVAGVVGLLAALAPQRRDKNSPPVWTPVAQPAAVPSHDASMDSTEESPVGPVSTPSATDETTLAQDRLATDTSDTEDPTDGGTRPID